MRCSQTSDAGEPLELVERGDRLTWLWLNDPLDDPFSHPSRVDANHDGEHEDDESEQTDQSQQEALERRRTLPEATSMRASGDGVADAQGTSCRTRDGTTATDAATFQVGQHRGAARHRSVHGNAARAACLVVLEVGPLVPGHRFELDTIHVPILRLIGSRRWLVRWLRSTHRIRFGVRRRAVGVRGDGENHVPLARALLGRRFAYSPKLRV